MAFGSTCKTRNKLEQYKEAILQQMQSIKASCAVLQRRVKKPCTKYRQEEVHHKEIQ